MKELLQLIQELTADGFSLTFTSKSPAAKYIKIILLDVWLRGQRNGLVLNSVTVDIPTDRMEAYLAESTTGINGRFLLRRIEEAYDSAKLKRMQIEKDIIGKLA